MIKFFRHIRQRLLSESKFSKYLLYAIGEIILVIIGILLALQINNWNTERNLAKESRDFSVRLLSEIKTNIGATDKEIARENTQIDCALTILKMFNTEHSLSSSRDLDSLIYHLLGKNQIDMSMATLNEGLNTGKIPLFPSDSLRNLLYGLPTILQKVRDTENIVGLDIDNILTPFLYQHLNWRRMDAVFSPHKDELGASGFPEHNSLECLDYMHFENLVDNIYFNSNAQLREYLSLKSHLELLEVHLER